MLNKEREETIQLALKNILSRLFVAQLQDLHMPCRQFSRDIRQNGAKEIVDLDRSMDCLHSLDYYLYMFVEVKRIVIMILFVLSLTLM